MTRGATEKIAWSRPPDLPGVETLLVESNTRSWRVHHETYTFCNLTCVPEAEWTYRRKTFCGTTGGLMLMEPGEVHANTKDPPSSDFRVLWVDPLLVEAAAQELGLRHTRPALRTGYVTASGLYRAFLDLHLSLENPDGVLERQSRLANCLRLFLETCVEGKAADTACHGKPALRRARDYIRENYAGSVSLEELGAVAGISRFHLVRAFAREFGLPPHAYQLQLQIAAARRLLADGTRPSEIATRLGFADQSHFTRHFRRSLGVTPLEYRKLGTKLLPP
jgi:AraC-like DNA-binding protein